MHVYMYFRFMLGQVGKWVCVYVRIYIVNNACAHVFGLALYV